MSEHISAKEFRETYGKAKPKGKQRGRETTDLENQLYTFLLKRKSDGRITDIEHQPAPLKIAHRCTYKTDATCINVSTGRREYWESKHEEVKKKYEDGWVKLKVAAQMYQNYDFFFYEQKTKDGRIVIQKIKVDKTIGAGL